MLESIESILYQLEKDNKKHTQNMIDTINTLTTSETAALPKEDVTKPTNPKDACGIKKAPISGMPVTVLLEAGLVKLHGDLKYGRYNWRDAGVRGSVYYDACFRHLAAWWEGEDLDPDSGVHHLSHAITGLAVLRDAMIQDNWEDDRPKETRGFVKELNKKAAEMIEKHNQ